MKVKDVLIPAGLLIAWLVFAQRRAINLLNYLIEGVSLSFDGITPVLNLEIEVQNVSNENYTINSFVGALYSGQTLIGNVSTFTPVKILPSSQTKMTLQIRLSLISVVSDLVNLIRQGSGIAQTLTLNGYINASGIVAPIMITYKVGA